MSNILKDLVKEIQFRKNWTIEQVANSIHYSRVHLNREMKAGSNQELIDLLRSTHRDVLQNVTNDAALQALLEIAASNKMLAQSILVTAEGQKITAESQLISAQAQKKIVDTNSDLSAMIQQRSIVPANQETPVIGSPISPGLRELLLKLGLASGTWKSKQEGLAELNIAFPVVVSKKKVKHTHPG